MSRNEDRAAAPVVDETPAPIATTNNSEGATFNWSVPTEFVTLPSGGKFYPESHPLHDKETVEIRYMTAKEEDILTSRSLIKEGVVIDRLLKNLVIDKDIDINSLLVGDKNALIVAARITGYGAEYETKVTCPACDTVTDFSFSLEDVSVSNTQEALELYGAEQTQDNTFSVTLPLTKAVVECRLLNGADEMKLYKEAERKARRKLGDTTLTDQFQAFIVSVNGSQDLFNLKSFIQTMPARDSRFLRTFYGKIVPNIDLSQTFECAACDYAATMEVPLTADFFWPK